MSSTTASHHPRRLPAGFFSCPDLSSAARWDLIRRSQQALVDLTQKTRLHGGPIAWALDHELNGVVVYRGNDPFLPLEASHVFLRVTDVRATLADMAVLLRQPDSAATYHKAVTVDCQTLYRIADDSATSTLLVQWRALRPSCLHRRRDYQDGFSMDGIPGVGLCVHSIDLPSVCPNLQHPLGYVRAYIHLGGTICFENPQRPGFVTVSQFYQTEWNGLLPPWLSRLVTAATETEACQAIGTQLHLARLQNAVFDLQSPRSSQHRAKPPRCNGASARQSHCAVCARRFLPCVRTKYSCHQCGYVACHRCTRPLQVPEDMGGFFTRVCVPCVANATNPTATRSSRRQGHHLPAKTNAILSSSDSARRAMHQPMMSPARPLQSPPAFPDHGHGSHSNPRRPSHLHIAPPGHLRGSCAVIDDGATTIPVLTHAFDGADRGSSVVAPGHYMVERSSYPPDWGADTANLSMIMLQEDESNVSSRVDETSSTATIDHRAFESTRGCINLQ